MRVFWIAAASLGLSGIALGQEPTAAGGGRREEAQRRLVLAIRAGDPGAVREAVRAGADPGGLGGISADSPVQLALMYCDAPVIGALAEAGADFSGDVTPTGWNALELALFSQSTPAAATKQFLDMGLEVRPEVTGRLALGMPAALRDPGVMGLLIAAGADIEEVGEDGYSPLALVAFDGTAASARALLEAGADPRQMLMGGREAIHFVGHRTDGEVAGIVAALKEAGADLEASGPDEYTALLLAVWADSEPAARALLDAGAKIPGGEGGQSALVRAVQGGRADLVKLLLERGADANAADADGVPALCWALRAAEPSTRWYWGPGPDQEWGSAREMLLEIERSRPLEIIAALLAAGADPNAGGPDWPPLALASNMWNSVGFERMEDAGADLQDGLTRRFFEDHDPTLLVKMLIDAGAVRAIGGEAPDPLASAGRRADGRVAGIVAELRRAKVKVLGQESLERAHFPRMDRPEPSQRDGDPPRF